MSEQASRYILWCPTSPMPPRVVLEGYAKARDVAREMADRHGGEFKVCEIVATAAAVKSITFTEHRAKQVQPDQRVPTCGKCAHTQPYLGRSWLICRCVGCVRYGQTVISYDRGCWHWEPQR